MRRWECSARCLSLLEKLSGEEVQIGEVEELLYSESFGLKLLCFNLHLELGILKFLKIEELLNLLICHLIFFALLILLFLPMGLLFLLHILFSGREQTMKVEVPECDSDAALILLNRW